MFDDIIELNNCGVWMKNQKGFTLVEGLSIVLILCVVGFAGYYVWSRQQNESTQIKDYQECVDAGNPIMESNPPRCISNGNTYTGSSTQPHSDNEAGMNDSDARSSNTYTTREFGISFSQPSNSEVSERFTDDAYQIIVEVNVGENPSPGVYGKGNYRLQMLVYPGVSDRFKTDNQENRFSEAGYEIVKIVNTPADGPPSTTYVVSNGHVTISMLAAGDVDEETINPFIESLRFN